MYLYYLNYALRVIPRKIVTQARSLSAVGDSGTVVKMQYTVFFLGKNGRITFIDFVTPVSDDW